MHLRDVQQSGHFILWGYQNMVYDKPHGLPEAAETTKYPRPN
jgi:hypothetical protein